VTVIATGFGAQRRRRRREPGVPVEEPAERVAAGERFEVSDEVLEVPSFLRDS
jgi:hypothetical protein